MALNIELDSSQQREVLVRMGWHPTNVAGLKDDSVVRQIEHLLRTSPERTEFELLRQVGKAWDADELK